MLFGVLMIGYWMLHNFPSKMCRLIINDSLDSGTQIPFIKEAVALDYGVLVMNTNQNLSKDHLPILVGLHILNFNTIIYIITHNTWIISQ